MSTAGCEILLELRFQAIGGLGSGEGIDDIDGGGEEDGIALEAGGIAQGGGQMGFPEADASEEDDIGFVFDELEAKEVLDGQRLIFLGQLHWNCSRVLRTGKRAIRIRR